VDNDLDVFLIEGTDGPGKDEDYDFRITMHDNIIGSVVDIFEAVTDRQVRGLPLDVDEMKQKGILGDFEVIYNNDWMYEYEEYEQRRVKNKRGCLDTQHAPANTQVSLAKVAMKAKSTALTKDLSALGFDSEVMPSKIFYMERRTKKFGEMVARSFRRTGWTPVDFIEIAQIIYTADWVENKSDDDSFAVPLYDQLPKGFELLPWQFYNHLPTDVDDIVFGRNNLRKHIDSSIVNGDVCRPIKYHGQGFSIHVYMLVVSWDPLIVFYHDGYLEIPYFRDDENDFLRLSELGVGNDGDNDRIWCGSWNSLDYILTAAAKGTISDPLNHVRNQFKQSLAKVGEGLASDISSHLENFKVSKNITSLPHHFGILKATFQVNIQLDVFLSNVDNWEITYGESYSDIVSLHDDLFGAAWNLLETLNTTITTAKATSNAVTTQDILQATEVVRGGYELLIYNPRIGSTNTSDASTSSESSWKFEYDWKSRAKDCSKRRKQR